MRPAEPAKPAVAKAKSSPAPAAAKPPAPANAAAKSAAKPSPPASRTNARPRPVPQPTPPALTPEQMKPRGDEDEEDDDEQAPGEPAPKIPTKRSPRAEDVGPPAGSPWKSRSPGLESFAPLPGLPLDTSFDSVGWVPRGPGATQNGDCNLAPSHPTAGCVTQAIPHPSDQNIIFISTANGGVWRTDNALATNVRWRPLTDDQLSLSIGGLALDATDPTGNTLVAGIGRRSSFGLGGALRGILRTTDGGATWARLGESALAGRSVYQIAVRGPLILLAVPSTDNGTASGLYRSTDTGATFANRSGAAGSGLPSGAVTHLASDPSNSARYYCHVFGNGIYRSTDSGATWTNISAGNAAASVNQLALTVAANGALFSAELTGTSRVFRSSDQGANWTQMDSIQANTGGTFNGFVADPSDANVVYLSGLFTRANFPFSGRVVRGNASLAAGSQWVSIASTQGQGTGTAPHTDSRCLVFTAGSRLIECDDGGIYELNIADVGSEGTGTGGGGTWRSLNGNLQNAEMHSMAYDRVNRAFIGGTQDCGFQEQLTPGLALAGQFNWNKTVNGDGGDTAIDYLVTPGFSVRYGSAQNFAARFRATYNSSNSQVSRTSFTATLVGGGTAIVAGGASNNMPFVTPIAVNAVAGGRLIVSGNSTVYESTDQGNTVAQIDTVGINLGKIAYGGRFGGSNVPGVLFYGSGSNIRWRTAASGTVTNSTPLPAPATNVQGVVFDPENWKAAYVIDSTRVFVAFDLEGNGAAAFTNLTGNLTGVGNLHTIEYLTLPGPDAIVVGADLGVFLMRLNEPGVWRSLGDNLPHAPVFDSHFDVGGQVLAVSTLGRGAFLYDCKPVKATGQYGETFQAYPPGTTTFPAGLGEFYSNMLGSAAQLVDDKVRALRLTQDGVGSTSSALRLPDLDGGQPVTAFSARWNATVTGDPNSLADGFSFNFGPLGGLSSAQLISTSNPAEDGFGVGLTVGVRTYAGNTPGYYVRYNGAVVPGGFVAKPSADWGSFHPLPHYFEVDYRMDTGLTLRVDGVTIFSDLPVPGFVPRGGDRFVFGARTGGLFQETRLDNLAILTNGVLRPLAAGAPYNFSSDYPDNQQTADKAFDGSSATKWLTLDYTGFIGATYPSAKTIRVYALTVSEDVPSRDPVGWEFQTGDNGSTWTQRGVHSSEFFTSRGEQRALVVASPGANTRFRLLVTANGGGSEIQLSELQTLELMPVPPVLVVTNTNDSGVGSLRQALLDAAPFTSATISFQPGLSGQTIVLASEIVATLPLAATIDASGLANGLIIDGGPGPNRIFRVPSGSALTLRSLTLTGGNGTGADYAGLGGAIACSGTVTLDRCTLQGNSAATSGGCLYNEGLASLTRCTLTANSAAYGGAISNYGTLALSHCTLAGNSATTNGGGVDNGNGSSNLTTLSYCIVAGNTAPNGADLENFNGSVVLTGASVLQSYDGVPAGGAGSLINAPALLAPLDNYGGPTRSMALRPGSPALEAASGSSNTADQRGFPIVGTPDCGAYEAGTRTNYNAFIWELLPATASAAQAAPGVDFDGDGFSNFEEWLALTHPASSAEYFRLPAPVRVGNDLQVSFQSALGRNYTYEYALDLTSSWIVIGTVPGTGGVITNPVGPVNTLPQIFLRVRASLPP